MKKVTKFEKQLIKGLISMYIAKNIPLNATKLENELRHITEENDSDHRVIVEEYIENEILKLA